MTATLLGPDAAILSLDSGQGSTSHRGADSVHNHVPPPTGTARSHEAGWAQTAAAGPLSPTRR